MYKDGHMLVLQASADEVLDVNSNYTLDSDTIEHMDRQMNDGLEIVQQLLPELDFERHSGMLVKLRHGYTVKYNRNKPFSTSCHMFATLVDLKDIQITQWMNCGERHGRWGKKDVDLMEAWNVEFAKMVQGETNGHYLLTTKGLHLTFKFEGHVMRDNAVIGLMTEPVEGRHLEYRDRALVYQAATELENHDIVFNYLLPSNIMISNGKVRFRFVSSAKLYPREMPGFSAVETQAARWGELEQLFNDINEDPIYARIVTRSLCQKIRILPRLPFLYSSPTPPPMQSPGDFFVRFALYVPMSRLRKAGIMGSSKSQRSERSTKRRSNVRLIGSSPPPDEFYDIHAPHDLADTPLIDQYILGGKVSRPYAGNDRSAKLLLACDDTDSTTECSFES
jgi:hypothetical protein